MFDVAQPGIPAGPHTYMGETWQQMFAWEISEAKRLGLQPAGDSGTFFQTLPLKSKKVDPMSSFIAAGTAHSSHGANLIPFFIYYSMFGFQRVGDLIWAAGDLRCRGFLLGGTSGRTTLNGEGLQHEDGHSQLMASTVPTIRSYDPAFGFELVVIVQHGLQVSR